MALLSVTHRGKFSKDRLIATYYRSYVAAILQLLPEVYYGWRRHRFLVAGFFDFGYWGWVRRVFAEGRRRMPMPVPWMTRIFWGGQRERPGRDIFPARLVPSSTVRPMRLISRACFSEPLLVTVTRTPF